MDVLLFQLGVLYVLLPPLWSEVTREVPREPHDCPRRPACPPINPYLLTPHYEVLMLSLHCWTCYITTSARLAAGCVLYTPKLNDAVRV